MKSAGGAGAWEPGSVEPAGAEPGELRRPARRELFGQDSLVQDGEHRPGLGALLLQGHLPGLLVDVQRLGAHAERVVRAHELGAGSLPARRRADRGSQLPKYLLMLAGRQARVDQRIDGCLPLIPEPGHRGGDDLALRQVGERWITP